MTRRVVRSSRPTTRRLLPAKSGAESHQNINVRGQMKLQGKRALITDGSSGIGLAIAEAMLTKGARVAVSGRRPDVLAEAIKRLRQGGDRVESITADVSSDEGRKTTIELALEKLGGLDILINNAGGVRGVDLRTRQRPKSGR